MAQSAIARAQAALDDLHSEISDLVERADKAETDFAACEKEAQSYLDENEKLRDENMAQKAEIERLTSLVADLESDIRDLSERES